MKKLATLSLILGIVLAVGYFGGSAVTGVFTAGKDSAVVEIHKANDQASKVEDQKVSSDLAAAIEQNKNERDAALKLVETLKADNATLEVAFNDLQKIQATHSCTRLGADFVRVFNGIVGSPAESVPRSS